MRQQLAACLALAAVVACTGEAEHEWSRETSATVTVPAPKPQGARAPSGATAVAAAASPMRIGNGVTAPVVIKRVLPDYAACEGERLGGFPIVEAIIDERGKPTQIRALRPIHPCLEEVTIAALKQWEFKPGTFEGKPVPVIFNLTVSIHWR